MELNGKSWFLFQRRIVVTLLLVIPPLVNGQVQLFHQEFKDVPVPYEPVSGKTINFDFGYQGKITQFWWWFLSTGWRDLHIRYTLPSGLSLEQIAGEPWSNIDSVFGQEIGGLWELNLKETEPGAAHRVTTGIDIVAQRYADPNLPVTGPNVPALQAIDAILLSWLRVNGYEAATIAVMKDRRLVYMKGYGWQDYDRILPILPDAVMRLASNTKPITARAIQQLIEDGMLDPQERI